MIRLKIESKSFMKKMNNLTNYSTGFLEGVQRGKTTMLRNFGVATIEVIKEYIDSSARVNPQALHHVYEWYQVGSPEARLFDLSYTVSNLGLSLKSTFRQSSSVKPGSTVPFYNKAKIMEDGIPVTIKPKSSSVLSFDDNGDQVFTKNEIRVENPGGTEVAGAFEKTFDSFMRNYFAQSFLTKSGLLGHLSNPSVYKRNLGAGLRLGKSKGLSTGFNWVANVGVAKV
jgi:hypothetical protein